MKKQHVKDFLVVFGGLTLVSIFMNIEKLSIIGWFVIIGMMCYFGERAARDK